MVRSWWDEPRVVAPPGIPWWDRALVAALVPLAVLETWGRDDVVWPLWHLGWALVCIAALLGRTSRPLTMLVLGYGAQTVAGVVPALVGEPYSVLNVTADVLLLAYSLGRWASGRAVAVGAAFLLLAHLAREPLYDSSGSSIVIGVGALLFPIALGATTRFWVRSQRRDREEIRLRERERLARDLHDTVAHHVSGILLQARAARVTALSDPAAAATAIGGIEDAAARSLDDMRALVSVLRDDDGVPGRRPAHGVADIVELAAEPPERPRITVRVDDGVGEVPATVGGALFRAAQEAVANARRHAAEATVVEIDLVRDGDVVTLRIHDDGRGGGAGRVRPRRTTPSYGLAGMRERFSLLGGQVSAGPDADGGWTVTAAVPSARRLGPVSR